VTKHVASLFSEEKLAEYVETGLVSERSHPLLPLNIYNYTSKAQIGRIWDEVTTQCRGLIVNCTNGEIVARPFSKFFNIAEPGGQSLLNSGVFNNGFSVMTKYDGSLGICYTAPDGIALATRGSFTSDQAVVGTTILRTKYPDFVNRAPHYTYDPITFLFEIIYPANRIVVDYGQTYDLVLLGGVNVVTGEELNLDSNLDVHYIKNEYCWHGPIAEQHPVANILPGEIANVMGVDDGSMEGFVLKANKSSARIKIKMKEYVRLHKLITQISTTSIWESLVNGDDFSELTLNLPPDIVDWVVETYRALEDRFMEEKEELYDDYKHILALMQQEGWSPKGKEVNPAWRKKFAELARAKPDPSAMFTILDDKNVNSVVWRKIRPEHATPTSDDEALLPAGGPLEEK